MNLFNCHTPPVAILSPHRECSCFLDNSRSKSPLPVMLLCLLMFVGCRENSAPTLFTIGDQFAEVGVELSVEIVASDSDGDPLEFSVSSNSLTDLTSRRHPAELLPFGINSAYLRWTPLAADTDTHELTVRVSDGEESATQTFTVTVAPGKGVPVLREPLGSGTTLDLSQSSCIELDILAEDQDSSSVEISLEEPIEEGYELVRQDPMWSVFSWCPTPKQIESAERYTLHLMADDLTGNTSRKKYVILLRRELEICPGNGPAIDHAPPETQHTLLDISLSAQVSDDVGLSGQPVIYYSSTPPVDPAKPDFDQFVQVLMKRESGNGEDGLYTGTVPNPVVNEAPGASRTVYYFFEATDNDDPEGTCDHRATSPIFTMEVVRPASSSTLGQCEPCSSDLQCSSGLCVSHTADGPTCLKTCGSPGASCTGGGTCSSANWTSVDGTAGLVCLPTGSSCLGLCTDDRFENNDWLESPDVPEVTNGIYPGLKLCGDKVSWADEDFYGLLLESTQKVNVDVLFSHSDGDVDLELVDENEEVLASSTSLTDNETVTACLPPGLYFIIAYSSDRFINAKYDMVVDLSPGACCEDDDWEPSNLPSQAIPVLSGDIAEDMTICKGDEDWYQIDLNAGDTLVVDLLFDQFRFDQDLDLYLYDVDGQTLLTPCCETTNGQSATADEQLTYTVSETGTYYVVVDGFEESTNELYLIGFDTSR